MFNFVCNNNKNLYDGKFEGMECPPILKQLFYVFSFSLAIFRHDATLKFKIGRQFWPGHALLYLASRLTKTF
jgi:hypothetical protein